MAVSVMSLLLKSFVPFDNEEEVFTLLPNADEPENDDGRSQPLLNPESTGHRRSRVNSLSPQVSVTYSEPIDALKAPSAFWNTTSRSQPSLNSSGEHETSDSDQTARTSTDFGDATPVEALVTYKYAATDSNELSLSPGDKVKILG